MLSSEVAQSFKSYGHFSDRSGSMLDFSGKANTSIHGLGEDDTAIWWPSPALCFLDVPNTCWCWCTVDHPFNPLTLYFTKAQHFIHLEVRIAAAIDIPKWMRMKVDSCVPGGLLLSCLLLFFVHLKLELLTKFPASNDEKSIYLRKINNSQIELFNSPSIHHKMLGPSFVFYPRLIEVWFSMLSRPIEYIEYI